MAPNRDTPEPDARDGGPRDDAAPDRDAPACRPVMDGWRHRHGAATWYFPPLLVRDGGENGSIAEALRRALAACPDFLRARAAELDGREASLPPLHREPGEPARAFERRLVAAVARAPFAITSAVVDLDLRARVRLEPGGPLRPCWVARAADLDLTADEDGARVAFGLHALLFGGAHPASTDDPALHRHNAPLLADALRRLERALGPVQEWEGWPPVHRHGFLPA